MYYPVMPGDTLDIGGMVRNVVRVELTRMSRDAVLTDSQGRKETVCLHQLEHHIYTGFVRVTRPTARTA